MEFFRFLGSKRFLKHLAAVIVAGIILIWFSLLMLKFYTRHGDYLTVPDFAGLTIGQVTASDAYSKFQFEVVDSVFDQTRPKGTILHQDPFPESKVKEGRKIYLTIVSFLPEKTAMPDLKNLSLRQAIGTLESLGLKVGRIMYIPAFDQDAVQQQMFEGNVIATGTRIDKGSKIDLTVGMGSQGQTSVPATQGEETDSM